MKGTRRVRAIWSWLPAFRAVAETEHVHEAAKQLGISPSALSRSIRLLEDQLGQPLFERFGRTLRLNPMGETFLTAVRDGIRRVDDGIEALASREMSGRLAVMSSSPFTDTIVLPALRVVVAAHPRLHPFVERGKLSEGLEKLSRGEIDVMVHDQPVESTRLTAELLTTSSCSVYCGPGHQLFGKRAALATLATLPFCTMSSSPTAAPTDGWPTELPRSKSIRVDGLSLALEACLGGELLAVLPDALALERRGTLWRIVAAPARWPLFYVRRSRLVAGDRTDVMVDALREAALRIKGLYGGPPNRRKTNKPAADTT